MKQRKLLLGGIALALIGGTALLLAAVPQKLGKPGVKASPVASASGTANSRPAAGFQP